MLTHPGHDRCMAHLRRQTLMSLYQERYGHRPGQFPVAEWLAAQTISLPVGPHVDEAGVAHMIASFAAAHADLA